MRIIYIPKPKVNDSFIFSINSPLTEIILPLNSGVQFAYNCFVDWGDGSMPAQITSYNSINAKHTYSTTGSKQIKITGTCQGFTVNNGVFKSLITSINNWGNCGFLSLDFYGCNNLSTLPTGSITGANSITNFYRTFRGCTSLTNIPTDLFKYSTLVGISAFTQTFYGCTGITAIPIDLFRYNIMASSGGFNGTFDGCSNILSIPNDLFRYNTLVTLSGFQYTFYGCNKITSIPVDLFRYNTIVSTDGFRGTFTGCSSLLSVPMYLFRYNLLVDTRGFYETFYMCSKLQRNRNIFFADGEESTRFLNKSVDFYRCFYIVSFTGSQGEAPPLWNCSFGTGTPVTTGCFGGAGNSSTSLSNYASIPAAWK